MTIVLPFAPGSNTELSARAIGTAAGKVLGQTVIFENRTGANGRLGVSALQRAPLDGSLVAAAADGVLVSQPLADSSFKLEIDKDYVPIAFLFDSPLVLAAHPSVPFRDVKGLIAYAKANPRKLNFAVGNATSSHFLAEMFRQAAGIEVSMVPYKGAAQSVVDLLAGRVDLLFISTTVKPYIESGKLVGLATSGKERWSPFPTLPTVTEAGAPMGATVWFGLIAPPGTSRDVVSRLSSAFRAAARSAEVSALLDRYGFVSRPDMAPAEFAAYIRSELSAWGPVIRKSGIKLE